MRRKYKYKAFVSYAYSPESLKKARAVETALETYAKPWYRLKPSLTLFRDEFHIAPGYELPGEIKKALLQSEFLIYLATEKAAQSRWVQTELRIWCEELKRADRLIIVHLDGEIHAGVDEFDWERSTALPSWLNAYVTLPVYEKLAWASSEDMKLENVKFREVITKIKARLIGRNPKELLKEIRNLKKRTQRIIIFTPVLIFTLLLATLLVIEKNKRLNFLDDIDKRVEQGYEILKKDNGQALRAAGAVYEDVISKGNRGGDIYSRYVKASRFLTAAAVSTLEHPILLSGIQHEGKINSARFSPDGSRIITASNDGTAKLADLKGKVLKVLEDQGVEVLDARFFPGGQRIITILKGGAINVWDAEGTFVASLKGHSEPVENMVFFPDGLRVLTASRDNTAKIWNTGTGETVTLKGHNNDVFTVCFSPDGERVLTGSRVNRVILWDLNGNMIKEASFKLQRLVTAVYGKDGPLLLTVGTELHPEPGKTRYDQYTVYLRDMNKRKLAALNVESDYVNLGVISPDGRWILTADTTHRLKLWDLNGRLKAVMEGHEKDIVSASFSNDNLVDNPMIVTTSLDNTVKIWDLQGRMTADIKTHKALVSSAVLSPDNRRLLTASHDYSAKLWELENRPAVVLKGHRGEVLGITFSPDGTRLLTCSLDKTAKLWDRQGRLVADLDKHTGSVNAAGFSSDGTMVLTASADCTAKLWDMEGKYAAEFAPHSAPLVSADFSPDGKNIVTVCMDKTARLWDLHGRVLKTFHGVYLSGFSPDTGFFLTVPDNSEMVVLRDKRGKEVSRWNRRADYVYSVAFSPDGAKVLTGSTWAKLWTRDGRLITEFRGHGTYIHSVIFANDGNRVLTVSNDQPPKLWGMDGNIITAFKGHKAPVRRAVFSPDNTRVATASEDGTAKLWDMDGNILGDFDKHTGPVNDVVFSPDGRFMATASDDGTAIIWYTPAAVMEWLKTARLPKRESQEE